jgi:eukaryotic-like serine/threonine-protein kinase
MSSSTDPLIGTVVAERYRIDRLLGEGGMGKVYAAEHVLMQKRLALKALRPELCTLPEFVARFEREALAAANIDHPNIAAATDLGKLPDGSLFLVLELVVGNSLRDVIDKGPMALERALHIARQIAAALTAAHALGIVHRDLKPENVTLVSKGGDPDFVKVLDFGVAKIPLDSDREAGSGPVVAGPLTRVGEVFGTPEYMAPEQALGQPVDGRADLYALGVITYELLAGVRPFGSQSPNGILGQQLAKPVPPFSVRSPEARVPLRVEQLVMKLLAKELANRFATAEEVVAALDDLLQPAAGAGGRLFTLTDGSPTAFFGSPAPAPAPATAALAAPAVDAFVAPSDPASAALERAPERAPELGAGGTLPVVQPASAEQAMARAAEERPPAQRKLRSALKHAALATRGPLLTLCELIDANRSRLPPRLRNALSRVPAAAMLTFVAVVVLGGVLGVALVLASARSPGGKDRIAAGEPRPNAPDTQPDPVLLELDEAKRKGHAALESLAERHPKSAPVLVELAASHAAQSDHAAAVDTLDKALELDPKVSEQEQAADVLAQAVRKPNAAQAALGLLEDKMGAAGARILYDLSVDQKLPATLRMRAERWVRSHDFQNVASPEIKLAAELRYGKSCSDRHALLARASEIGDKRALAYLKIMRVRSGCGRRGRSDCFSCLRKDDALAQAISSIEKRVGEQSAKQ